ncbi:DUF58 domain-containing protein [uncultured Jatrophihabitans sp.]|uniref:DUF58 domain-containing protein n=1 Tax=uncultured Jatrophihabitans sp. TaxID=1610747 RepID=UPI0035CC682B
MANRRRLGFTTRASCLLAAGITAVLCGVLLGETDLVRAGVLAAAIPLVAAVIVHRSRLQVANRRGLEPRRAASGDTVTVNLTITNRSVLPTGALMLEDQLPGRITGRARFVVDSLSGREARTISYRIPALGRGRYRVGPLRIRLGDPFRMIELTRSFSTITDFLVTPRIDRLPAVDPPRSDELGGNSGSHSIGSNGADDASTREYRTGDDLRKIHWRSTARSGQLMVRQAERPWRANSTVLLDVRTVAHQTAPEDPGPGSTDDTDERRVSSLEWAVSAAGSIGVQAMRAGRDVGLIADTQQAIPAQQGTVALTSARAQFADADQLSTYLATVHESPAPDLTRISDLIRTAAHDSTLIAVLGRLGTDDIRLLCGAQPRGRTTPALALLLDVDTWVGRTSAVGRPSAAEAAGAVLRSSGWRVQVVPHGMALPHAWQLLMAGVGSAARAAAAR